MKKLGLALGGGGLKGLAHIGVLQVLEDYNIPIAMISGTSAGSIIAALYASGMSAYTMEEVVTKLKPEDYLDYNITGLIKFILGLIFPGLKCSLDGFIIGRRLERLVFQLTDGKYLKDSKLPLAIIACDINSGHEIVFASPGAIPGDSNHLIVTDTLMSQAVRASIAIPAIFVPSYLREMQLVDGGVRSVVPVAIQKLMGAEYVLAINLGTEHYQQGVKGIAAIVERSINILTYETSATEQKIYADMAIYPGVEEVKLDDLDKALKIIRMGRRAMKNRIMELQDQLLARV